ncbi:MAG: BadF/BadG/BcrA/BcrD ATPase family protein [Kiritimatiellia bacterium]|jgi:glucosamine kinase
MDDRRLFLAVDSGGTKCDAVVADATGAVLSRGSHRRPGVSGRSAEVIRESIRAALVGLSEDDACFDVFLTGVPQLVARGRPMPCRVTDPAPRRKAFVAAGALAERQISGLEDISETMAALAMHGLDEGIVALSGTGAYVHVFLPARGIDLCYDGYGPLLGDHGGAYQIGLAAFRAAAAAHWSPRRATSLRHAVFNALNISSVPEAVALSLQPLDRSLLASLAILVEKEAVQGDAVAQAILLSAADALAETLADALAASGLAASDAALVGTGSIATRCAIYWDRVCQRVRALAPGLRPMTSPRPAVLGTLVHGLAIRRGLRGAEKQKLADRVMASYDAFSNVENPKGKQHVPG